MFEKIMDLVKGQVAHTVKGMDKMPAGKKTETVETTAHSLVDSLKQYATPEHLSSLTSLLGIGGGHQAAQTDANPAHVAGGLESGVVSALTSKVGLSPSVAQKIAGSVIPAVMSLFKKKVDDDNEPGFNLGSLLGSLTGKGSGSGSSGGGLMDMIGGMFGKKG